MQLRTWAAVIALTMIPALSAPATAAPSLIERYGNIFARNVCGATASANEARCFSKVVTDSAGNIRPGKSRCLLCQLMQVERLGNFDRQQVYFENGFPSFHVGLVY